MLSLTSTGQEASAIFLKGRNGLSFYSEKLSLYIEKISWCVQATSSSLRLTYGMRPRNKNEKERKKKEYNSEK